jgi:hypothetical protein
MIGAILSSGHVGAPLLVQLGDQLAVGAEDPGRLLGLVILEGGDARQVGVAAVDPEHGGHRGRAERPDGEPEQDRPLDETPDDAAARLGGGFLEGHGGLPINAQGAAIHPEL